MLISFLDQAYEWLCQQRQHYPPVADVWHLRYHWQSERGRLVSDLQSGKFRLGPMSVITGGISAATLRAQRRHGTIGCADQRLSDLIEIGIQHDDHVVFGPTRA